MRKNVKDVKKNVAKLLSIQEVMDNMDHIYYTKKNNFILYKMNDLSDNIINEEVEIIDVEGIKFRINSITTGN